MSELREIIKTIQRATGCTPDGIFGPETATAVVHELAKSDLAAPLPTTPLDSRSFANIETLDPKCQQRFWDFLYLAKATAATLGCDYVMIQGNRSWAEQDALYAQGRTAPGSIVTKARGGQSNHNFQIAGDFGVFQGKMYLDGGTAAQAALAAKVHKACSMHAEACGLEWGGKWTSIVDLPHYEIKTGLSMMQKRDLYKAKGSVL